MIKFGTEVVYELMEEHTNIILPIEIYEDDIDGTFTIFVSYDFSGKFLGTSIVGEGLTLEPCLDEDETKELIDHINKHGFKDELITKFTKRIL